MVGYRVTGPVCGASNSEIDSGTNARARTPPPGIVCVHHHTAEKKSLGRASHRITRDMLVVRARSDAIRLLNARLRDLKVWDSKTAKRFVGWFGTDEPSVRKRIAHRIGKVITKLMSLEGRDFVTDGASDEYGFVIPGDSSRTVHLGALFWTTDDLTRAGTLIHEASHFRDTGATADVGNDVKDKDAVAFPGKRSGDARMYGGVRATRLAISNPKLALENADNFEFFIENREPSLMQDESGRPDFEGIGDFPNRA